MKEPRKIVELFYDLVLKPILFKSTQNDPEVAHILMENFLKATHKLGLERFLFDCPENHKRLHFEISNAAGFNKNGYIAPSILKYIGCDRMVVGTVTYHSWQGNPRPRILRIPDTETMVNWMGLPGIGAHKVCELLKAYDNCLPITYNFMSTPQRKHITEELEDIEGTLSVSRDIQAIDRYEYNFSCPNTYGSLGNLDARSENQTKLAKMLATIEKILQVKTSPYKFYLKVSPDMDEESVSEILEVCGHHQVDGFTIANTSTKHKPQYIPVPVGKGGVSGEGVYKESFKMQKLFENLIEARYSNKGYKLIACGGISSPEKVKERLSKRTAGIQMYSPLIFKGPKLIRQIRSCTYL